MLSNVPPNTGNAKPYTLPMVRIRDGDSTTYVMDSQTIAEALERLSPSPPLRFDSPLLGEVEDVFRRIAEALRPVLLGLTLEAVLTERSAEYYSRVRAEALGMPIALYAEKYGGPRAWEQAQEPIAELAALLKREPGHFLTGENRMCPALLFHVSFCFSPYQRICDLIRTRSSDLGGLFWLSNVTVP